ncbi:MAG: hypothetical protein GWN58_39905 [Anaerolineae bacterium]|nr:hypothetical protein [Anaerolineae bacterium]
MLGGTFNPVTRAHLELAGAAMQEFSVAEVLFILPTVLPHRAPEEATLEERLALLAAALACEERFSLAMCSHGLLLEMARALAPHYPSTVEVYFLLGSDAAERILRWNYPDPGTALAEMFACFDLVVAERGGPFVMPAEPSVQPFRRQIHTLRLPPDTQEISATRVRERLQAGQPVEELLPPAVSAEIRRLGLYRAR